MSSLLEQQVDLLGASEPDLENDRLLAHWFVRNVLGQEALEAYEYVFDAPAPALGLEVDAAFLTEPQNPDLDTSSLELVIVTRTTNMQDINGLAELLGTPAPNSDEQFHRNLVVSLITELAIPTRKVINPETTRVNVHFVAPGIEGAGPTSTLERLNFETHTASMLEQSARAASSPAAIKEKLTIEVSDTEILSTSIESGTVFVCPVHAVVIAGWPGIADNTLFDLNVRFKLGGKRVRQSLDDALSNDRDAGDFLASHNGLTVVCDEANFVDGILTVENFSVVNGTQSVIAFWENRKTLSDSLRVIVKFAVVGTEGQAAREIAIRSNTQNPVNSRNLRALDTRQLKLRNEFLSFPPYEYEIRPGTKPTAGAIVIKNDDAAQWLCAVYNERPWLAVKRLALFEQPAYDQIFNRRVLAQHVIFSAQINEAVQAAKLSFPVAYQRAWKLTSLVGVYLAAQIMRADERTRDILGEPSRFLLNPDSGVLAASAAGAAEVLTRRRDDFLANGGLDDFKVDFKREAALRALASAARQTEIGLTK